MKKSSIILIVVCAALVIFVATSAKVIDKGTESQYTGVVAFDASASSGDDWDAVLAEITGKAEDIAALDLSALGDGKAVALKGAVTGFESKANGKKNTMTVAPEGYSGDAVFTVQLGAVPSRRSASASTSASPRPQIMQARASRANPSSPAHPQGISRLPLSRK